MTTGKRLFIMMLFAFMNAFAAPLPYCLSFNGVDQYVHVSNTLAGNPGYTLQMQTRFTIELWFKVQTFTDGAALINNGWETGGIFAGYGIFTADSNRLLIRIGNGLAEQHLRLDSIPANTWHHLAVTYNRFRRDDNLLAYLNGNLVQKADCYLNLGYPAGSTPYGLFLGRSADTDENSYFDGMLDDVRIWNAVRSKPEIRNAMNAVPDTLKTTLLLWYSFNDGSGNTLSDGSAYQHHGQLINMPDDAWQPSYAHLMTLPCNDVGFRRIALNWSFSPSFDSYTVDLSTDPDFASSADGFPLENIRTSYYVLDDIEPGTYYYRVRGHIEGQDKENEPWSDIRSVSTVTDAATPIVLADFGAVRGKDHLLVFWRTESQVENACFLLQRSEDQQEWETVAQRDGAGTIQESISYHVYDRHILPGKTYYYRLTDISYSGESTVSPVIGISVPENAFSAEITLGEPYPNPFNPRIAIPLRLPSGGKIDVRVFSMDGRCVEVLCEDILASGWHTFFWEPAGLPSGIYLLRVHSAEGVLTSRIHYIK